MNIIGKLRLVSALAVLPAWPGHLPAQELSLESAPPVVIHTTPRAGAADVDPGMSEISVTFSKPMQDGSWSWSTWGEENFPQTTGEPRYLEDSRTCVLPVKLVPNKFYATWLNSSKFKNFTDGEGRPAVPYLLAFQTGSRPGGKQNPNQDGAKSQPLPEPPEVPGVKDAKVLAYHSSVQTGFESISGAAEAVLFTRERGKGLLQAVQIFGSRYGTPEPPQENFFVYVLDDKNQVLAKLPFPYSMVQRGKMKWYTLRTPGIEVPEKFTIAIYFNAERTKGVYLAQTAFTKDCRSRIGMPDEGFDKMRRPAEWVIRAVLTSKPSQTESKLQKPQWAAG